MDFIEVKESDLESISEKEVEFMKCFVSVLTNPKALFHQRNPKSIAKVVTDHQGTVYRLMIDFEYTTLEDGIPGLMVHQAILNEKQS